MEKDQGSCQNKIHSAERRSRHTPTGKKKKLLKKRNDQITDRLRTQSQLFSLSSYEWGSKRPMRAGPSWVAQLNMGGVGFLFFH